MKSGIRRYPAALAMALAAALGGPAIPSRRLRQMARAAAKQPVELADAA